MPTNYNGMNHIVFLQLPQGTGSLLTKFHMPGCRLAVWEGPVVVVAVSDVHVVANHASCIFFVVHNHSLRTSLRVDFLRPKLFVTSGNSPDGWLVGWLMKSATWRPGRRCYREPSRNPIQPIGHRERPAATGSGNKIRCDQVVSGWETAGING